MILPVSPARLLERLVDEALTWRAIKARNGRTVTEVTAEIGGRDLPDHLLPGRAILRLSAEERAVIARLRAPDTACRDDFAALVARW